MEKRKRGTATAKPLPTEKESVSDSFREIPSGKPARVGNFRLWRGKKMIGRGKDKYDIDQINVSTLDDSFQVKIPSTIEMYALIRELYGRGDDGRLATLFGNMYYVSCVGNGYYQHAITLCSSIYANPSVLNVDDAQHAALLEEVQLLVSKFLEWRKDFDAHIADNEPSDEEMEHDRIADEIVEELSKI